MVLLGCLLNASVAAAQVAFSLAQVGNQSLVKPGGLVAYTISYSNVGTQAATGVVISEAYDPNLTFVSANPAPDAGTTNQWSIGTLTPGLIKQIVVKVRVAAAAPIGTALSTLATISDASVSAQAGVTTTVSQSTRPYVLTHTGGPRNLRIGVVTKIRYKLKLRNLGTSDTTTVTITDTLPAGLAFVQSVPMPTSRDGNTLTYVIPVLPSEAFASVTIDAALRSDTAAGTVLANTAVVTDDQGNTIAKAFVGGVR